MDNKNIYSIAISYEKNIFINMFAAPNYWLPLPYWEKNLHRWARICKIEPGGTFFLSSIVLCSDFHANFPSNFLWKLFLPGSKRRIFLTTTEGKENLRSKHSLGIFPVSGTYMEAEQLQHLIDDFLYKQDN